MKKNIKIKIGVMILGLFSISGCSNLLDQEPLSLATPDNFWVSQPNAETAVAGCYGLLKNTIILDANFLFWGEFTGMTYLNSQNWIVNYIEGSGDYVLPYRDNSRDWKGFYRAANWALAIEKHVSEMPDSKFASKTEKDRLIGEAAFIRSLSYFYMARIWGDVPIVTEVIESSDQLIKDGFIVTLPREDEKKVLDYALEAANKAISLLQYSSPSDPRWAIQANKASAEALKTHIALWYASRDNDNQELLNEALVAATSVINNSNASLIDYANPSNGLEDFNKMCIGQSETGLFEINISSDVNESFRITNADNSHTGLTLDYPIFKSYSGSAPYVDPEFYGPESMYNDSDRDNDVRKELFFSDPDFDKYESFLMKYSQRSKDPNSIDSYANFSESNILIFRLADIYLLRAEANMKLGHPNDAVDDINMIRSKANVPNYTGPIDRASLTKAIFDERAIELVGEGQSGFDRIRMNYYSGVNWMNPTRIAKEGYFWPVHPDIISVNAAIIQTDFWKGRL